MSHVVQVVQVPQVQVMERTVEIADSWKIVKIPENSHYRAIDL